MKLNRKYLALLYLCIVMPTFFFFLIIILSVMLSLYIYIINGYFEFYTKDIYFACKLAILGIPTGIVFWFVECRRLGIKIFGK